MGEVKESVTSNKRKMKTSFTNKKINETFDVAMKYGLDKAEPFVQRVFKNMLYDIAMSASDEIRQQVSDLMCADTEKYKESKQ